MSTVQIIGVAWLVASFVLAPVVGRLMARNTQLEREAESWHQAWTDCQIDAAVQRHTRS